MAHLQPEAPRHVGVPAELLDRQHPLWRDPDAFARWCARYGVTVPSSVTWAERFERGRDGWARADGITTRSGGTAVDHGRLRDLGVPHVGALARAQARSEQSAR